MAGILHLDLSGVVRRGVKHLLAEQSFQFQIEWEASSIDAAKKIVEQTHPPKLIITDLFLDDFEGVAVVEKLTALKLPIIVFSHKPAVKYAGFCIKAGAKGYVNKNGPEGYLVDAIQCVQSKRIYIPPEATSATLNHLSANTNSENPLDQLSARELEIFRLLGAGASTAEISHKMGISPRTVDVHRTNIRVKLGLPDGNAVVRKATIWYVKDEYVID